MPKVTFIPDDVTVHVGDGENLLRAAMMADVPVTASCGGDGTCGKCRVVVQEGSVEATSSAKLTEEQVAQGYVLACTAQVSGDLKVRIPPESRPGAVPARHKTRRQTNVILSAEDRAARLQVTGIAPAMSKRFLALPQPTISDNSSDLTRVRRAMRQTYEISPVVVTLDALRELPNTARQDGFEITATVLEPCEGIPSIVRFESGNNTNRQYAIAVDIGTTTIEAELVDLRDGSILAQASEYNAQVTRGEDVISRVITSTQPEGLSELNELVVHTISELVDRLTALTGVELDDIVTYVVAGNTVMTHLLFRVGPQHIRAAPYVPAASSFPIVRAAEIGLPGGPATHVLSMPCPASWLGGDIIAGIIAAGIPWSDKLTMFVDIGTNGEIVLGNKEWIVACSCSAGPAFEGGGILHGMRAAEGAIEQVRIDTETLEPMFLTIGETKPIGICGSGLIDCVAELFMAGAIGRNGKFVEDLGTRFVREGTRGLEYVLVSAEDSGTGSDIALTEVDIDNLMRAKAAVYAGTSVLLETVEVDFDEIDEVVVAGGFGHYLDLERVTALGMMPELDPSKFVFIGNGSLLGARAVSTSRELLQKAQDVSRMLTYVELSVNAGFMDSYMSAMFFPHTDLSLFPRSEERLRERGRSKAVR